jgi:ribosomal-protein-alanine N-acetyltransferase
VDGSDTAAVRIDLLTRADAGEVLEFEIANRAFFAAAVGDRGDDYFAEFASRHEGLVAENEAGTCLMFLVRDRSGRLVGRVNLIDVEEGRAELGYRIAEDACGQGYARRAVRLAVAQARARGLREIWAKATVDNVASQRVLSASGFEERPGPVGERIQVGERSEPTLHYVLRLDARPA